MITLIIACRSVISPQFTNVELIVCGEDANSFKKQHRTSRKGHMHLLKHGTPRLGILADTTIRAHRLAHAQTECQFA